MIEGLMTMLGASIPLALLVWFVWRQVAKGYAEAQHEEAAKVTAEEAAARVATQAATLNAEAAAAVAANDVERMRAMLRDLDATSDEVVRLVPTRDVRHAIKAHEREQRWQTREPVGMFEGEPAFHTDDSVMVRKRGGNYGTLVLTATRAVFVGERRIELPLARVYHVHAGTEDLGQWDSIDTLSIQLAKQARATKFYFDGSTRDELAWWLRTLTQAAKANGPASAARPLQTGETAEAPTADVGTDDDESLDFETDIVGEVFEDRQFNIQAIVQRAAADSRGAAFVALLVPEPQNPHDANAVAVVDDASGAQLGYLSRNLARAYQPAVIAFISGGQRATVPGVVRGERDSLGVWLDLTRFNTAAGLPAPEQLLSDAGTYFERRSQAGTIDGVPWTTHRQLALEAARLDQPDVAAEHFDKAVRGWLARLAFDGKGPNAGLFEEYARWCRKGQRQELELTVLRTYMTTVAAQEPGSTRSDRMKKRLTALTASVADEAPF